VAKPPQQDKAPSGLAGIVVSRTGQPADVIELIMADHRRIRRLRAVLDDAVRCGGDSGSGWMLAHVWQRLAGLLEVHTRAEEEICYLLMFGSGPLAGRRRQAAAADHDDIRDAIGEAALQPAGSARWWGAVRAVLAISAGHLEREERDMLVGWQARLTMSRRRELGRQWLGFTAALRLDAAQHADDPTSTAYKASHQPNRIVLRLNDHVRPGPLLRLGHLFVVRRFARAAAVATAGGVGRTAVLVRGLQRRQQVEVVDPGADLLEHSVRSR